MKKVLLIVLCVVLACSAVACSAEAPAETGSAPATESVAVSEEPKETEPATTAESADASASEAVETAQYEAREPKNGDHYVFGFTEWGAGSFFDSVYGAIEEVVLQNGDEIIHLEGQADSKAQLQVIEDVISQDVDAPYPRTRIGRTYTPLRVRALCRGLVGTERKPLASLSDRHWRLCRNKGLHPLRRLRGYPCTPTKTVYPPLASVPFLRVFILSGR